MGRFFLFLIQGLKRFSAVILRKWFGEKDNHFDGSVIDMSQKQFQYVDNGLGLPALRQPYKNVTMKIHSFLAKGNYDAIKDTCHRYLTAQTRGTRSYIPLWDTVLITYAELSGLALTDNGTPMGTMLEQDLAFFIPTLAVDTNKWGMHLAFFPFQLYIDNAPAIVAGREIYGFNKTIGGFQKKIGKDTLDLTVSTLAVDTFSEKSLFKMRDFINISPSNGGQKSRNKECSNLTDLWGGMVDSMQKSDDVGLFQGLLESAGRSLSELIKLQGRLVFLKQFRSVTDGSHTCYQSVVEAPISLNQFVRAGFYSPHDISFQSLESNPICEQLGMAQKQENLHGIWGTIEVTIENGEEISSASGYQKAA